VFTLPAADGLQLRAVGTPAKNAKNVFQCRIPRFSGPTARA
jgi:hypothetical protein